MSGTVPVRGAVRVPVAIGVAQTDGGSICCGNVSNGSGFEVGLAGLDIVEDLGIRVGREKVVMRY